MIKFYLSIYYLSNGATACGLFLAMSFILEKIKMDHECDVCQAVRYVRHNRKQFVRDKVPYFNKGIYMHVNFIFFRNNLYFCTKQQWSI